MDKSKAANAMKVAHEDWGLFGNCVLGLGVIVLAGSFFIPTTVDVNGRFGISESVVNFHGVAIQAMVVMTGLGAILGGILCKGISAIIRALRGQMLASSLTEEREPSTETEVTT
ncbi:hypothetical protein [Erythrobacter sp. Alg231-14]|uniref:hypothetical protein n=1 Tax=Erythrobacter sp. Alg231-14 TaxID=1922225 RepID=UPI000D553C23